MIIQAKYKRTKDSLRALQRLNEIQGVTRADIQLLVDCRSIEDQMLLRHLSSLLNEPKVALSPAMLKAVALATILSVSFIAVGLGNLFGYL